MNKDVSDLSNSNVKIRKLSVFFIFIVLIGIAVCIGFLFNALIRHELMFELLNQSPFNTKNKFLGFSCFMSYLIGLFIMLIAFLVIDLAQAKQKLISFSLFLIGFFVVLISDAILIAFDIDLQQKPLKILFLAFQGLSISILFLSYILSKFSDKYFIRILKILSTIAFVGISCLGSVEY